jgi:hypothetical protein
MHRISADPDANDWRIRDTAHDCTTARDAVNGRLCWLAATADS